MRKQNWLRVLHVGHAGHWDAEMCLSLRNQRTHCRRDRRLRLSNGIANEQPKIGGDQFVAAASGVQLPSKWAQFLNQSFFNEVVHIFGISAEKFQPRGVAFGALGYAIKGGQSQLNLVRGENADAFQRFGPRAIHRNFVRQQAAIERERTLKGVKARVRRGFEAASP